MALPSLNTLRAFEATARTGSFASAAEELCVSSAAVGQMVRKLEVGIDRRLFHRNGKRLTLTEAGFNALPKFSAAFEELENAVLELQDLTAPSSLTISVPPSFAVGWLSTRISDFIAGFDSMTCSVRGEEDPVNFEQDAIDIRLTYGNWHYPGYLVEPIMQDVAIPVCTPDLLASRETIATPEDVLQLPLIHTQWPKQQASYPSWHKWHQTFCEPARCSPPAKGHTANSSKLAIDLALSGLGVALAQGIYVSDALRSGALVCPIDRVLPLEAPYCLNIPASYARNETIDVFKTWLKAQVTKP